jgi:diphthine synthase
MLYIIGLGLNEKSISLEGLEAVKKCKKIFLETYTVDFPYSLNKLEKTIKKKISKLERKDVESDFLIKQAKNQDICLLVYGSPLFATTHLSLLVDCMKAGVKYNIVFAASVFDAIAITGLQLYKFGKVSSMPTWKDNYKPTSFLDYVIENNKIQAHSLMLVDIGLEFKKALEQLEQACKEKKIKIDKIIVCSRLGTDKNEIFYGKIKDLEKKKVFPPYCFILPGKLHFLEKEILEKYGV